MRSSDANSFLCADAVSVNDLENIIGIDVFTNIDDRFEEMVESDVYLDTRAFNNIMMQKVILLHHYSLNNKLPQKLI